MVKGGVEAPPAKCQCQAGPKAVARRGFTFSSEVLGVQPAFASTGDQLRKITVPVPAVSGAAISIAFDGSNLLYTNWQDPNLYHITANGALVQTVPTGLTFMTALSWDSKRNKLWVCDSGRVFLMDHMTGAANQQFAGECFDGLAYDATDDTLYMSFDAHCPVYQRRATDGALLRTINCTIPNSGKFQDRCRIDCSREIL